MSRLIVHSFTISLDGYGAGPNQTNETPLGAGGEELHEWLVGTRFFMQMTGRDGGTTGIDNEFAEQGMANVGAYILGRNMFGPVRGPWPDDTWRGWWGKNPPYHTPTFVLTHHERTPLEMEGGTVFHFVTDGIRPALDRARAAAGDKVIRLLGGASTIRQYLLAGLVDVEERGECQSALSADKRDERRHLLCSTYGRDGPAGIEPCSPRLFEHCRNRL